MKRRPPQAWGGPAAAEGSEACAQVRQRATQTLAIAERNNWLLDIALDHLILARCALYADLLHGRTPGRRNGPLGSIALEILALFGNLVSFKTGRLDPSLDWIMDKLKRSRDAVVRALKALRDHGFLDWLRRFEATPNEGRGSQVRQVSNAYRLFAPKRALALLGRWSSRPSLPDDDAAARADRKAIEAEHVASLDLGAFASFQCGDSPLGRALAQMGKALDLRESVKRTESQSTSYSYVVM